MRAFLGTQDEHEDEADESVDVHDDDDDDDDDEVDDEVDEVEYLAAPLAERVQGSQGRSVRPLNGRLGSPSIISRV